MLILVVSLVALCVFSALFALLRKGPAPEIKKGRPDGCCGQHVVCEKESLLTAVSKDIVYYDDEDLDRFRCRPAEEYTDEEAEEFREVIFTMKEEDVAGWVRSLQLRGVDLPNQVKDDVLMIVGERRMGGVEE